MPTLLERGGDFSQAANAPGQPIQIVDPATGQPFAGNVIPSARISPQAASLLGYYPLPNVSTRHAASTIRRRCITGVAAGQHHDARHAADQQPQSAVRHVRLSADDHRSDDAVRLRGREPSCRASTRRWQLDAPRHSVPLASAARYQFTRADDERRRRTFAEPHQRVRRRRHHRQQPGSVELGTAHAWRSRRVTGLTDALPNFNRNLTHRRRRRSATGATAGTTSRSAATSAASTSTSCRSRIRAARSRSPARPPAPTSPTFCSAFPARARSRSATPTSICAPFSSDAYVTDDWRVSPTFTMQAGVRWEYETPMTEALGRLVESGRRAGLHRGQPGRRRRHWRTDRPAILDALIRPDRRGIQPRLGIAWRPVPGSSLVVRAGYGIYRNTNVYQSIATAARAAAAAVEDVQRQQQRRQSADARQRLHRRRARPRRRTRSRSIPNLRVGYAQNWQALGAARPARLADDRRRPTSAPRAANLMQEFLPNTYPAGAVESVPDVSRPASSI